MLKQFTQDRFKIFLIIAVIILIGAGLLVWLSQKGKFGRVGGGDSATQGALIAKVAVNLTPSQRAVFAEAVKKYRNQIARGDSQGERTMLRPYLYLGINYESLGELELARQAYLNAAAANQASDIPWSNLGSLYQQMGSLRLSQEALMTATRLNPKNSLAWQKLIELYFKMNETDASIEALYRQAIDAAGANHELVRDWALYLEQKGEIGQAILQWQILLQQAQGAQAEGIEQKIKELQAKSK